MKVSISQPHFLVAMTIALIMATDSVAHAYPQASVRPLKTLETQYFGPVQGQLAQFPENGSPPPLGDSDRGHRDEEDFRDELENRREDFEDEREDRREDFEDNMDECLDENDEDDRRDCIEDLRGDYDGDRDRRNERRGPWDNENFPSGQRFPMQEEFSPPFIFD